MAVENDHNPLVVNLNHLAQNIEDMRREVEERLLREKREGLEPNATHWVNPLAQRMPIVSAHTKQLEAGARQVIMSRPGEAVFEDQPSEAPDGRPDGARAGCDLGIPARSAR
jgi:hypothetical protein